MALLRHLAIRCRDMEKSRDFYQNAIGWQFVDYRPTREGVDLSDGVNNITLLQQPAGLQRPPLEEGNEYIHFGVIVDDLQSCWRRCREWGAEICASSVKQRAKSGLDEPPEHSFKVLDPDGNIVDVTANWEEWRGVTIQRDD
ncbi:MAG: VOC family protein [Pirellulaceae bacterium]|jgi:catechol 2,3-dioxygenase-like lactoylglutathione lyase family enzyme|nr:VOC family protein [Pirellulaceae bacterium]MDP7019626.1 VOC family protein [Pirellulaceae bacterium]